MCSDKSTCQWYAAITHVYKSTLARRKSDINTNSIICFVCRKIKKALLSILNKISHFRFCCWRLQLQCKYVHFYNDAVKRMFFNSLSRYNLLSMYIGNISFSIIAHTDLFMQIALFFSPWNFKQLLLHRNTCIF